MNWEDPIVDEVRTNREKLLREHGGFDGLVDYLKKKEKEHPELIVTKDKLKSSKEKKQNTQI